MGLMLSWPCSLGWVQRLSRPNLRSWVHFSEILRMAKLFHLIWMSKNWSPKSLPCWLLKTMMPWQPNSWPEMPKTSLTHKITRLLRSSYSPQALNYNRMLRWTRLDLTPRDWVQLAWALPQQMPAHGSKARTISQNFVQATRPVVPTASE